MSKKMRPPKMKKIPSSMKYPEVREVKSDNTYNPQPSLRLGSNILPEVADWKVGSSYDLTIKVQMTGINTEEYGPNKGTVSGEFRITHIATKK